MRGRGYDSKIEIWGKTEVSDGYGGYIPTETLIKSVWAGKESKGAGSNFQQFGLNNFKNPVIFRVRGKSNNINFTENSYIMYKGKRFEIKGIDDVNFDGLEFEIYADET